MAAPALPPGHAIQEYRIQKLLGVGGSGLTYLARDENLGLKVALKEYLPPDVAQRAADKSIGPRTGHGLETFATAKRRFLNRATSFTRLRHPNLARAIRCFEANGSVYLAVELIEGEELTEWVIPRRPLDEAQTAALAAPLLDALEALHGAGLPHGDIKAASIRVRRDGSPALLDFSPAPEPAQSAPADLYAFAALLYWMTTGIRALEASTRGADDTLTPALQAGDGERFGSGFLTAIDWALAREAEKRPQSVRDWREALLGKTSGEAKPAGAGVEPAPSATAVDAALLQAMQAQLAQHLGPIAALVVKSAAQKASTASELVESLAREIADPKARFQFQQRFAGVARPGGRTKS